MTAIGTRMAVWVLGFVTFLQPAADTTAPSPGTGSEAERIAHARDAVTQGKKALETLRQRLDAPDGEYKKAEADFQILDKKLTQTRQAAAKLRKDGKPVEAAKLEAAFPPLQDDWHLARERFDLAIRQRKVTQEAVATLQVRVAKDQAVLDQLEGKTPPPDPVPPAKAESGPTGKPDPVGPPAALPSLPGVHVPVATAATPAQAPTTIPPAQPDDDPAVRRARHRLETRQAEQQEAETRARAALERVKAMEQTIRTVEKMLGIEQEAVAYGEKAVGKLSEAIATRPPADPAEKQALAGRLADAQKQLAESRDRVQRITDRTGVMAETLRELKGDHARAAQEADESRQAAEAADAELAGLLSPLAWRNMVRWAVRHGPNLLTILVGIVLLHLVIRQSSRHIVRLAARNANRGSPEDRENRANTLVGVFRYAAGMTIFGGGVVMLLDEAGVPVVPLMGGAAVLGLAVAFGAQNLIRDYFTGFMMLTEDQFSVNDVVKIGGVSGVVEKITLRMIVLRDLEGVRHFIPHGTVTNVSNLTHGWSRALFDVPVSYAEDVDRIIGLLRDLGGELRADPEFGKHILEDPEMLGVEALADSRVVIRFLLKTRPLQQWPVRREMLRRIKKRFDELGIVLPTSTTQTVYHRFPEGSPPDLLALPDRRPGRLDPGHEVDGPHTPTGTGGPGPGRVGPRIAGG
ncbi:MAG: MscS Mechanosensitive ion channel [Gemmataceae bacterium]|nr:MscS Mechanosensitive ion channel [Gemmataceae bacterium]